MKQVGFFFFLEFPCFLYDPANVGNLISGSSAFSKPSLDIWKFLVCIMLKPSMQDFKHNHASMGDECNCPMVSTFFSATLLGNWDEDWPSPVLWPWLGLPDLLTYWMQHLNRCLVDAAKQSSRSLTCSWTSLLLRHTFLQSTSSEQSFFLLISFQEERDRHTGTWDQLSKGSEVGRAWFGVGGTESL